MIDVRLVIIHDGSGEAARGTHTYTHTQLLRTHTQLLLHTQRYTHTHNAIGVGRGEEEGIQGVCVCVGVSPPSTLLHLSALSWIIMFSLRLSHVHPSPLSSFHPSISRRSLSLIVSRVYLALSHPPPSPSIYLPHFCRTALSVSP